MGNEIKTLKDYIEAGCPNGYCFQSKEPIRSDGVRVYRFIEESFEEDYKNPLFKVQPVGKFFSKQEFVSILSWQHLDDLVVEK